MGHVDLYGESRDDFDVRFANFHVRNRVNRETWKARHAQ